MAAMINSNLTSTKIDRILSRLTRAVAVVTLMAAAACQQFPKDAAQVTVPETSAAPAAPVKPQHYMIAAANPLAADAGLEILRRGGSAVDAAIAAQMVLNVVEPQSSGIGGGAFMLHFAAESGAIDSYDGRETAPASAHPEMFLDDQGKPRKFFDAVVGGLSVGVPGTLRMLEMAYDEHGQLPWADLFEPAIELADKGFAISARLAGLIKKDKYLNFDAAGLYFYEPDGTPKAEGTVLRNPEFAETLRRIAAGGADALHTGTIARAIVKTVTDAPRHQGGMNLTDLAGYKAKKRPPVCLPYRDWLICGMGPPSSGGVTMLQILGMLQRFDLATLGANSVKSIHVIAEASRLAFADRNVYMADPDFIPVPIAGLLDPAYLDLRSSQISPFKTRGKRLPGMPGIGARLNFAPDDTEKGLSTTHLSVIDKDGNAVSMTSSIENAFGSRLMTGGFLLNNQLTDFAFMPERNGAPVANRAEAGKRPRSSMSPTLVFDGSGRVVMAVGSPGGSRIIGYVTKTLIAALDWGMDMDAAIDSPHFVNRNGDTNLEQGTALEALKPELEAMGHDVSIRPLVSGLHGIQRVMDGLDGGADHRREGVAIGD